MKKSKVKWGHRPPRIPDIIRAQKLKRDGLSVREISLVVLGREDKKTIYRWLKIDVGKSYPQVDLRKYLTT